MGKHLSQLEDDRPVIAAVGEIVVVETEGSNGAALEPLAQRIHAVGGVVGADAVVLPTKLVVGETEHLQLCLGQDLSQLEHARHVLTTAGEVVAAEAAEGGQRALTSA